MFTRGYKGVGARQREVPSAKCPAPPVARNTVSPAGGGGSAASRCWVCGLLQNTTRSALGVFALDPPSLRPHQQHCATPTVAHGDDRNPQRSDCLGEFLRLLRVLPTDAHERVLERVQLGFLRAMRTSRAAMSLTELGLWWRNAGIAALMQHS